MIHFKICFIEGVRFWWRFWSVKLQIAGTVLLSWITFAPDAALQAWTLLPQDLKAVLPEKYLPAVSLVIFLLSIFARFVAQPKLRNKIEEAKQNENT